MLMKKDIVEEVYDDMIEMSLEEAQEIDPRYEIGDAIEFQVTPRDFGRIAAQTAKQVVVQRIREAERGMIFDDFITKQGRDCHRRGAEKEQEKPSLSTWARRGHSVCRGAGTGRTV